MDTPHTDVSIKCYLDCKSIYRYTTKAVCYICRIANNHTFATATTEENIIFFINRTSKLDHTFFDLLQKLDHPVFFSFVAINICPLYIQYTAKISLLV